MAASAQVHTCSARDFRRLRGSSLQRVLTLRDPSRLAGAGMDRPAVDAIALKLQQVEVKLRSYIANHPARNPRECVSCAYFAVLHAVAALLRGHGNSEARPRVIAKQFALNFIRTGALPPGFAHEFSVLRARRMDADYNEAILIGPEDARAAAASGLKLLSGLLRALDSIPGAPPTVAVRKLMARIAKAVPLEARRREDPLK